MILLKHHIIGIIIEMRVGDEAFKIRTFTRFQ